MTRPKPTVIPTASALAAKRKTMESDGDDTVMIIDSTDDEEIVDVAARVKTEVKTEAGYGSRRTSDEPAAKRPRKEDTSNVIEILDSDEEESAGPGCGNSLATNMEEASGGCSLNFLV